ncbi:hypothetical protein FH972_012773 [Carpinus fangiana]|uniref:Uncharacterized protein n=1 Tax=Carpinus fangiana TaxID=176857 RepID=A0A5N6R4R4_9ROSI|nr:hypothetical protein FH972_012773 [Carpinus fangiana]
MAKSLDSDLNLAYHLQMQEAMTASLALQPSTSRRPSAVATVILRELNDRVLREPEIGKLWEDLDRRIHHQRMNGNGEGTDDIGTGESEAVLGLGTELKLGQVPLFKCSESVLEGLEAEKTASLKEHLSLTALGRLVSELRRRMGSKWVELGCRVWIGGVGEEFKLDLNMRSRWS